MQDFDFAQINHICSNLINFAQILPQIFPHFTLILHQIQPNLPKFNQFSQKKF